MKFVQNVQGIAASTAGIIKFQDLAYSLAIFPSDNIVRQIGGLMPQPIRGGLFHPFDFVGSVELEAALPEQDIIPYVIGDEPRHARQHLTSFLDRHISAIVGLLREGPLPFGTLIMRLGFTLEPEETLADFVGIYTFTENNETHVIKIGLNDNRFETRLGRVVIHGNNAMLTLMQEGAA